MVAVAADGGQGQWASLHRLVSLLHKGGLDVLQLVLKRLPTRKQSWCSSTHTRPPMQRATSRVRGCDTPLWAPARGRGAFHKRRPKPGLRFHELARFAQKAVLPPHPLQEQVDVLGLLLERLDIPGRKTKGGRVYLGEGP